MKKTWRDLASTLTLILAGLACCIAHGGDAPAWRGDMTGCFPDADPPTRWQKVSGTLVDLRCRAQKPDGEAPAGAGAYAGAFTEWLVLGPLPVGEGKESIDEALVADESSIAPNEGDKLTGVAWKKITVPGHSLNFSAIFAEGQANAEYVPYHELHVYKVPYAAYAHTYVWSPGDAPVQLRFRAKNAAKAWLNGELVYPLKKPIPVSLKKGWNRLTLKAVNRAFAEKPGVWTETDYPSWWFVDVSCTAKWPFETQEKNIRWAAEMPSHGVASPLIVGDRIFVLAEPGRVICVDRKSGKVLWDRAPAFSDTLGAQELASPEFANVAPLATRLREIRASLTKPEALTPELAGEREKLVKDIAGELKKIDAERFTVKPSGHGNCLGTPVSDGKAVYVALGNGLAARYDLDGTLKWATLVSPGRNQEHGITSSAVIAGGKLIVFHIDLAALDLATGKIEWKSNIWRQEPFYGDLTHQTPLPLRIGGQDFVYIYGEIHRVGDGEIAWDGGPAWKEKQAIPTPIVVDGTLYDLSSSGMIRAAELPTTAEAIDLGKPRTARTFTRVIGAGTRGFACASPLYHDGLLYVVDAMGNLFAVDAKTLEVVYRKDLGIGFETRSAVHLMGVAYASPVLAGKHLYVFGMDGTTVVLKPGRAYEEVARNKIEDITNPTHWSARPEGFASTPVADGDAIYVRGDKYLYCIGKREE